jgi:predicted phage terminase large subunit-like protein
VWGETSTGYCLLHLWRQRAEFPELKRQAVALAEMWRPQAVLIEDAASGQSLIQALRAETRLPILPVKPLSDKVARATAVTPLIESGRVYLPEAAPWLTDFMDEVSSFPAAPHDDVVDALSQGLNYLRGSCDPVEYYRRLLLRQGELGREAEAQGRSQWVKDVIDRGRAAAEKLMQEIREQQDREEKPNQGRILPSLVNYATRRPA